MYRNKRNYSPKTGNFQSSIHRYGYQSRGNQRRTIKKLDTNLFIKKASNINNDQYVSSKEFTDFSIVDKLKRNILEHGYSHPTEIQEKTIPHLLYGSDVIGI